MKKMKKIKQLVVMALVAVMCMGIVQYPVYAYDEGTVRDDGTWLFPLDEKYYTGYDGYGFSDWAGCPGKDKCVFCNKRHIEWEDNLHSNQGGHNGIDISVELGTEVKASASGIAYYLSGDTERGNVVIIETSLGNGYSYYHYYQHLSSAKISDGTEVKAGTVIALSGNTGVGAGPHLHMGIVMGRSSDEILSKGKTAKQMLDIVSNLERKGWIQADGYVEGRILNNPASTNDAGFPISDGWGGNTEANPQSVINALKAHYGSVHYTFDVSKVTVGITIPEDATSVDLELVVDKEGGAVVRSGPAKKNSVVKRLDEGTSIHAYAWKENKYGNIWYLIGNQQWIYAGNVEITAQNSRSSIFEVDAPSNISCGSYYTIAGTINAPDGKTIKAVVIDSNGKTVISVSDSLNNGTYSLKSSKIDYGLTFNTLSAGTYTLKYIIHEEYDTGKACVYPDVTIFSQEFTVR
jgi:murein DD-endopeptidase MepM/ murein hydrolase activator NlpD